ncbi:MAG: hypothetical protein H6Q17_1023 [Bacteroidetes bacterium]|nr:hypothetical protein [Bacteroidota bacterium]
MIIKYIGINSIRVITKRKFEVYICCKLVKCVDIKDNAIIFDDIFCNRSSSY